MHNNTQPMYQIRKRVLDTYVWIDCDHVEYCKAYPADRRIVFIPTGEYSET